MARTPRPLHPRLQEKPFLAREIPPGRARRADLWAPTRGTRAVDGLRDLATRCSAHALTLPGRHAFSHTTAARLLALPLPLHTPDEVHITTALGLRAPRRAGAVGHQAHLVTTDVVRVDDVWATAPARTFVDLATLLPLTALVAVGDRILSRRDQLASWQQLADAVAARTGARGAKAARAALDLLDDGAESPKETELRLVLRFSGMSGVRTNWSIFDERGRFVARVDLALPHLMIAIEYEGDHHRDKGQWRADLARRRRIEALGWTYLSVTQADLDDTSSLLADLRAHGALS